MEGLAAAGADGKGKEERGLPWRRACRILKECKQGGGRNSRPPAGDQNEKFSSKGRGNRVRVFSNFKMYIPPSSFAARPHRLPGEGSLEMCARGGG